MPMSLDKAHDDNELIFGSNLFSCDFAMMSKSTSSYRWLLVYNDVTVKPQLSLAVPSLQ